MICEWQEKILRNDDDGEDTCSCEWIVNIDEVMKEVEVLVHWEGIHKGDGVWEGVSEHDAFLAVLIQLLYEAKPVNDQPGAKPAGVEERS